MTKPALEPDDEDPNCAVCGRPHIEHKKTCQTRDGRLLEIRLILSGPIDEEYRWHLEDEFKQLTTPPDAPLSEARALPLIREFETWAEGRPARDTEIGRRMAAEIERRHKSPDYYPSHEALCELLSLQGEYAILNGGGPGWSERWETALANAVEITRVEP